MTNLDPERPYASKTFAEVVDDYVLVRGDLGEAYAREQLVREHEARLADLATRIGDAIHIQRFARDEGTLRGPDNYYNGTIAAERIARDYQKDLLS